MAPKNAAQPSEHKGRVSYCITSIITASLQENTPALHEFSHLDPKSAQRMRNFIIQRLRNRKGRTIAAEASYLIENSLSVARECLYDSAEKALKKGGAALIKASGVDLGRLGKDMRLVVGKRVMRFKSLDEIRRIQSTSAKDVETVEGLLESSEESSEEEEEDESDESDKEEERDDDDEVVVPGDSSSQVGEYSCRKRKHGK